MMRLLSNGDVVCYHKWVYFGSFTSQAKDFTGVFCDRCGMRGDYLSPRPVCTTYTLSHHTYSEELLNALDGDE